MKTNIAKLSTASLTFVALLFGANVFANQGHSTLKSGKLRAPDYYDVTCSDGFKTTCYPFKGTHFIARIPTAYYWVCNNDGDYTISNSYSKPVITNEGQAFRQFRTLFLANQLVGKKACSQR